MREIEDATTTSGDGNAMRHGSAISGRQSARATGRAALTAGCWLPTTGVNPLRLNNLRISLMDSRFCREFLSKSLIPGDGRGGRDKQLDNSPIIAEPLQSTPEVRIVVRRRGGRRAGAESGASSHLRM